MYSINEIFRNFGQEYLESFGTSKPNEHRKVIDAIIDCRTKVCGMVVYKCIKCNTEHMTYRSCGNRHCPKCQNHKTRLWVDKQIKRQLPGHHFMITFTVPEQLRRFIRSNQRIAYAALFKASSQTMKQLTPDPKYIGGDMPGFFGVLHTWGRQLQYHPHIHYVVPGGAVLKKDGSWHSSRVDFYLPVKAMSKILRKKFYHEMEKTGLLSSIPDCVWTTNWNVNCQAIGNSGNSIKYLAPYVFKVAISDSRIVKVDGRNVFLRYKKKGSGRWRTMKLDVMEFIRRFLQHVLPTGFMKVRYYGFLNPSSSFTLEYIRQLMGDVNDCKFTEAETESEAKPALFCSHCEGELKYSYSILPYKMIPPDTG